MPQIAKEILGESILNSNLHNDNMVQKQFQFPAKINGHYKTLSFSIPTENGGVRTDKYCPQELLTGGLSLITAMNGEAEEEFITDCRKQIMAMEKAGNGMSKLEVHKGGLMAVVMEHLARCGRLIFGDLLIYTDIFCYLLAADGYLDSEIRKVYPNMIRTIVEMYPDYIFNTRDLSPFKGSHFDFVLFNVQRR